jgi:uncharacterized protein with von Willebrand factor type A (vWA) domain
MTEAGLPGSVRRSSPHHPDARERMPVVFAWALRAKGLVIPVDAVISFGRALGVVGLDRQSWAYWAGRATLVRKPEVVPNYDDAFASFWFRLEMQRQEIGTETVPLVIVAEDGSGGDQGGGDQLDRQNVAVFANSDELLGQKDFAMCTPNELEEAHRLMRSLRVQAAPRRSRRWRRSSRRHGRPDTHRTIRQAVRKGGEVVRPHNLGRTTRPRRVVLLCDVSGSMEVYARVPLRFLHVAVVGRCDVEAFALRTRLTRLTRYLASRGRAPARKPAARGVGSIEIIRGRPHRKWFSRWARDDIKK